MHDPLIVAHEIKYPWYQEKPWPKKFLRKKFLCGNRVAWKHVVESGLSGGRSETWPEGYRETFLTIWHVDPEKDGTDDSCGYSHVKLTQKQKEKLRNASWSEGKTPHFLRCHDKTWDGTMADVECLQRGIYLLVCRVLRIKMSWSRICRLAAEATHIRDCIGAGSSFCYVPGYHSNNTKDNSDDREEHFYGILCCAARFLLTEKRPWWKHPKWHFWHWKLQCHPLVNFKRWAFSRCSKCGGRFSWGYAPVTNSWNGTGPLWFRSEKDTFHSDCNRPNCDCVASSEPTQTT